MNLSEMLKHVSELSTTDGLTMLYVWVKQRVITKTDFLMIGHEICSKAYDKGYEAGNDPPCG